jgi:hypothetical protein
VQHDLIRGGFCTIYCGKLKSLGIGYPSPKVATQTGIPCIFNAWGTRKRIICNVSAHPTALWLEQQLGNLSIETFDNFPCALVKNNEEIFGKWLDHLLKTEFHVDPIPILLRFPRAKYSDRTGSKIRKM